ncbi:hypothetical protein FNV43_RR22381 [Rhamnella rubrinervis]|uniref:KIB1-4 beta-propeller domain-containing protein n=1 Tax=Rhamnella rubrinervis TaxID=2594499 RepID=A0A8K0GR19_9ROSA|nr:hypothetical protein FNV43_RR22381 [Rhamnella rubrinervis]
MGNMSSVRSCLPLSCLLRDDEEEEKQHQLPWLIVNLRESSNVNWYMEKRLYNVTTNQVSNFVIPCLSLDGKSQFRCSIRGWWFFMDNTNKYALTAFNPLSSSIIHLPPFDDYRFSDLQMIMLPKDPLLESNFEVLAMSWSTEFAHFKSGNESWTFLDSGVWKNFSFASLIFSKDRLLAAHLCNFASKMTLLHLDVDGGAIKLVREIASMPCLQCCESEDEELNVYLVETTKGDVLAVHRYSDCSEVQGCFEILMTYRVYKLISCHSHDDVEDFQFIHVKDLDGESIFLENASRNGISVLASDYRGCIPNSIYYASYLPDNEIEVFHMEDESLSKCFIPPQYIRETFTCWMYPPP